MYVLLTKSVATIPRSAGNFFTATYSPGFTVRNGRLPSPLKQRDDCELHYLLSRSVRNSRGASGLKPAPTAPLLTVPPRRLLCHWQRAAPSCRKSSAARNPA